MFFCCPVSKLLILQHPSPFEATFVCPRLCPSGGKFAGKFKQIKMPQVEEMSCLEVLWSSKVFCKERSLFRMRFNIFARNVSTFVKGIVVNDES